MEENMPNKEGGTAENMPSGDTGAALNSEGTTPQAQGAAQAPPPTPPPPSSHNSKTLVIVAIIVVVVVLVGIGFYLFNSGLFSNGNGNGNGNGDEQVTALPYDGKKVLYVDSYHEGYEWSDGITHGVRDVFAGTGVDLKIHRMDTKRNTSEEFKKSAALEAKSVIEEFGPDVVIVSDDNAFKYLVQEYYKDDKLPFTFSGLNWDASVYGAPYTNTAGMVEVSLTVQIIDRLKEFNEGDRLGYLTADVLTEHKNLENYEKIFGLVFEKVYFVSTMEEWKAAYLALQDEVDQAIFENNAGIEDWDEEEAKTFAIANAKIPIGTTNPWTMGVSVLGITKVPEEQGTWSAEAAISILDGIPPSAIPIVTNKEGHLMVNLTIAEKIGIVIPPSFLRNAEVVR